jgi:glycosyltransferase involved in cell wall biosynthesis
MEKEGRESIKKRLGLNRGNYVCFIGRLLADKQVDYLIDVYELIKKIRSDTGLLIIGDGPEKNYLEKYVSKKGLKDIHFLGGIADWEQSGQYLYVSDVMVMPGYVGLSVNHSFCFGLPVITQMSDKDGPFHSPEIEYIIDGETGFICQKGNKEEMTQAITKVFDNKSFFNEKVTTFCKNKLSIDTMVYAIKEAVDFAVSHHQN